MLLTASLAEAEDLSWVFKRTDARIQLVMADDSHLVVEATPVKPVNAVRGNSSWTLTFELRGVTAERQITGSPIYIDLGPMDPKGLANPINLVKLDRKAGTRTWVMKVVGSDFFPALANEVFPLERRPKPVQSAEGNLTLTVPAVLPPGEYAVFTDVEAWEFSIKAR
jgi:hypothetical protein